MNWERIVRLIEEARELENRAAQLRRQADAAKVKAQREAAIAARKRAIRAAALAILMGTPDADAAASLTRTIQISERDAAHCIAVELASVRWLHKVRRNREICRLARNHTNGELAARFGISEKHVSRIINAARLDER